MRNDHHHSVEFDFHIQGLEILKAPDDLHVGSTFAKPAPIRAPKPTLWQRIVKWFCQPDSGMRAEAEVFRGLNNPFL